MPSLEKKIKKRIPFSPAGGYIDNVGEMANYIGNDVHLRRAHISTGSQKSWIDKNSIPTDGNLVEYYFYAHNITSPDTAPVYQDLIVQIWRPTAKPSDKIYDLVWQKIVRARLNFAGGALYTVSGRLC